MHRSYLIAVDMGVSFVKVGLYDTNANLVQTVTEKVPGNYPEPGVFIQKADDYLELVLASIKKCIESSGVPASSVEGIGFSAAMGGALGIDKDFNIAADWSIVSDSRFNTHVLGMLEKRRDMLLKHSGTNFPVYGAKILWWKNDFPQLHKKVCKYIFLCSYIAGKLANIKPEDAFIDRSHLQWTALADLGSTSFSEQLCESFGIEKRLLPRIVNSFDIIGKLDKNMAELCSLREGIPLIAGAGDKPAGTVGAGLNSDGLLIDESASFAALSLCVERFVPDLRSHTLENLVSPIEGLYLPSIFINGSGVTHQWFIETFCQQEQDMAYKKSLNVYKIMDDAASKINPGSDKLLAIGLLGGRGYPFDPDIRGMWLNHDWSYSKAHFWRSLLESFAYEYASALNKMRDNYPGIGFDEIRVIGGAARSDLWNQIKCDVTGIPYVSIDRDDLTMLGDIILAGHGVGIYGDLKRASGSFFKKVKRYEPDDINHKYYQKMVGLYEGVFDKVRDIYRNIKNIPYYNRKKI